MEIRNQKLEIEWGENTFDRHLLIVRHSGGVLLVFGRPAGRNRVCLAVLDHAITGSHTYLTDVLPDELSNKNITLSHK